MAKGLFLLILLLVCLPAGAAKVVKVNSGGLFHLIVDNSQKPPFEMNHEVCVKFAERRGLCGLVFALKGKYAAVRFRPGFGRLTKKLALPLEAARPEVMAANKVALIRAWQRSPGRGISGFNDPITQFEGNPAWEQRQKVGWPRAVDDGFHPSNSITFGINYISPFMRYEVATSRHWSFGLKMQYEILGIPGGQLSGYGGVFNANYYSLREFKGLWIQFGAGFYSLQTKVGDSTGNFSTPAIGFMAGWRWSWKSNFSVGFGFGSEFLFKTEPAGFAPAFSGALPVVMLDFGIVF